MEGKQIEEVNNGDGYEREAAPIKCRLRRERNTTQCPNTVPAQERLKTKAAFVLWRTFQKGT